MRYACHKQAVWKLLLEAAVLTLRHSPLHEMRYVWNVPIARSGRPSFTAGSASVAERAYLYLAVEIWLLQYFWTCGSFSRITRLSESSSVMPEVVASSSSIEETGGERKENKKQGFTRMQMFSFAARTIIGSIRYDFTAMLSITNRLINDILNSRLNYL